VSFVSEFEPKKLWYHFDQILTIPRGSKNEHSICQYVCDVARRNNLNYIQDAIGNVIVTKAASPGFENSPSTILQCHLDMVNEKNSDVVHDFNQDPLRPLQIGEYLTADGTTLGADNGIGIAACLAVLEDQEIQHGPLECLFTVDEETGLTGAQQLSEGILKGKRMINLDSEEDGVIYVGCAGGADVDVSLPIYWQAAEANWQFFRIGLTGLKGGHSGVDIHLQRGNAIQLLARILYSQSLISNFMVCQFNGGNMRNAIPRESTAIICVPNNQVEKLRSSIRIKFQSVFEEYRSAEPEMKIKIDPVDPYEECLTEQAQSNLLCLILGLPHGVQTMSYDIPDLVETSSNLAKIKLEKDHAQIHISNRSSVESALEAQQELVTAVSHLSGAEADWIEGYPGWKPDLNSALLKITKSVFEENLNITPEVKAIHAGLECGIIKKKYPELDMVSIGPQIEFPHSPDERVQILSVDRFYSVLVEILKR
jgi:dipeptidase D